MGIMIEPGYYNLSEYIGVISAREGENWNERCPYVQLRKCFDDVEVVIRRVDGLSICGDNENLPEIVVDPRYAQVLSFEKCHNLTLSGLTMGHTETRDCIWSENYIYPESGETVILPYTEGDNTYDWVYLEMYVEKFCWFENGNAYIGNITWDCDEDNHAWITLEERLVCL